MTDAVLARVHKQGACTTRYMTVCTHLQPCVQAIDEVLALVDELVACITQCGFRIFDPLQAPLWEATREEFHSTDANVQDATMNLINTSFRWGGPRPGSSMC